MTEDEAKTKWCPFVRMSANADNTRIIDNRGHAMKEGDETHVLCIGSACMAWRVSETVDEQENHFVRQNNTRLARQQDALPMPEFKDQGYCGLAGKL